MKILFFCLAFFLSTIGLAADKMIRCEYVGGAPCQCQYESKITIDDDGPQHGQTRTVFIMKNCPGDIADRLSRSYWGSIMNPDDYRTSRPDPSFEYPQNDFNSSPFAAPLAQGLNWLFSKHEESTLQAYLDKIRNWAPIDPQMAKDVEHFRHGHTDALGQMERGDKENYEYLQELLKLGQGLYAESQLPAREKPTPLPNGIDDEKVRQQYKSLYKHAQNNEPLELNQELNQIIKRLNLMNPQERAFHRTELARTFLNKDLTFKSLPYVNNPDLKLKSRPDSVAGAAIRSKINGLMAAESQAMQNMHNQCNSVGCKNVEDTLGRAKQSIKQIYKSLELQDRVKDYLVDSAEFESEANQLVQDFTQQLGSVTNDQELNGLLDKTDNAILNVQIKRIDVKKEALQSWGGDSRYSEEEVSGLAKTSGQLVEYAKKFNDKATASFYRSLGEDALDLAMDFTPGVSTAKDLYELVSGHTLLRKEELSVTDLSIRAVSVAVDVATLGIGGRLTKVALDKGLSTVRTFLKSDAASEVLTQTGKSWDAIKNYSDEILSNVAKFEFKNPATVKSYARMHEGIETLPSHLKIRDIKEGISPDKIAIIGRKMNGGVNDVAAHFNGKNVNVETFLWSKTAQKEFEILAVASGGRIPYDQVISTLAYKENKEWAERIVREGYNIFDIRDPLGANITEGFSPFYDIEKITIFGELIQ